MMTTRPIEACYWVEPGRFLAGEYPGAKDPMEARARIEAFVAAGIDVFIDLTETTEPLAPYASFLPNGDTPRPVIHQRFPIRDVSVPESPSFAAGILDAIDGHLAGGRTVYVHCWGGIGRTGTIIGCWLVRHGFHGRRGVARLRELWKACPKSATRQSPETPEQEAFVLAWDEGGIAGCGDDRLAPRRPAA